MKKIITSLSLVLFIAAVSVAQVAKSEMWPNGNKKSEGFYKNVLPLSASASKADQQRIADQVVKVGKWQYWFENGQMQAEETYTMDGAITGTTKSWYANGTAQSVINTAAKTATYWFENGQKQSEGPILANTTPTGKWTGWYDNGVKNFEGSYDASGQKDGIWKFWDINGQPNGQQTFRHGNLVN
jgi:antitoxin component YwqK of YwqJK toxin-antitoxin module